jgi:hypothetical protein
MKTKPLLALTAVWLATLGILVMPAVAFHSTSHVQPEAVPGPPPDPGGRVLRSLAQIDQASSHRITTNGGKP